MRYQYDLAFQPTGQHSNAGALSRLPRGNTTVGEREELGNCKQIKTLPVRARHIQESTRADSTLSQVCWYTMRGWPSDAPEDLNPYYQRHYELGGEVGCLFWVPKVVIPTEYQSKVLTELHLSHPGIVRMKGLAHMHVWWPVVDSDIEQIVHNRPDCQSVWNQPLTVTRHLWPQATSAWERIHVDCPGPFWVRCFYW